MPSRRNNSNDFWFWAIVIAVVLLFPGVIHTNAGNPAKKQGGPKPAQPTSAIVVPGKVTSDPTAARALLKVLKVVPDNTTVAGYDRLADFGKAWADVDHNGCDTRDDVLKRDLSDVVFKNGSKCLVASGVLVHEPYTGKRVVWTRSGSAMLDIDHMVPLGRAWIMGAAGWEPGKRLAYANDPEILLTVDGAANRAKGDQGPGTWMPPDKSYACTYAAKYIGVSAKYKLSITQSDARVLNKALEGCR